MINLKLDLCKSEWLELVFVKRNHEYGAYYLRQHNAENTTKAMAITFVTVVTAFLALGFVVRVKPKEVFKITPFEQTQYIKQPEPPKKEKIHSSKASAPKQVTSTRFVPPVIVAQVPPEEPTKLIDIKGEVGPETIDIPDGPIGPPAIEVKGTGGTGKDTAPAEDNTVHSGVDVEPEPFGGAAAWAKFLQKNLRYPQQAIEQGITGKVFVTFIVEKDGHISSLEIVRGVGYGLDEEALRVLKMALPWKPGKQHGNAVRVKYTLPLNFTLNN